MLRVQRQSKSTKNESKQDVPNDIHQISNVPKQTVPVLKPITETITFKNNKEFDEYYTSHKEEIDKLNKNKLNKMFLIPEYKITKIQGILSLKLLTPSKINHTVKLNDQEVRIDELERKIIKILEFLDIHFDHEPDYNLCED
jgi:hypothetical protein